MTEGTPAPTSVVFTERLITGIRPTTSIHLGHYQGVIAPLIRFQDFYSGDCFVLIADLHQLSGERHPEPIQRSNQFLVSGLVALGVDPERCVIFRQSDVASITELMWILACFTGKGSLERGHAYKDAVSAGRQTTVGLYLYPLLQAADVLSLRATRVPAGVDQRQHVELARDLARKINNIAQKPILPEPVLEDTQSSLLPGTDGTKKMSSAHNNIVSIFADEMTVSEQINSIRSPSVLVGEPVDPEKMVAFKYFSTVADQADALAMDKLLRSGSITMAAVKDELQIEFMKFFHEARIQFEEIRRDEEYLEEIIYAGAERARQEVLDTVLLVRESVGF